MRNTLKHIFKHTGTIYGQDISNELHNRRVVVISKPRHTADVLRKHAAKVSLRDNNFHRIQDARIAKEAVLLTAAQTNRYFAIPLAELQNYIEDAAAKHSEPLDIILHGDDKVEHEGNWRTYRDRQSRLDKQRCQDFSMILGQCTQKLLDRIKQENGWQTTSYSYDPLSLIDMIEKTVLAQTEDQYLFAILYEQGLSLYGFHQNVLTNSGTN